MNDAQHPVKFRNSKTDIKLIQFFSKLMIQAVELNDKYFCAFNDSKNKKKFKLSKTARKIFQVARIFDATLSNFTNGRAIAPLPPCLLRLCVAHSRL